MLPAFLHSILRPDAVTCSVQLATSADEVRLHRAEARCCELPPLRLRRPSPRSPYTDTVIHATTILAVRHQRTHGHGQRRPGHPRQHGGQARRPKDPPPAQRVDPRRVRRLRCRLVRALLALRVEARTVPRQSRALGGRARPRLAHRPAAAPSRGDDDRRRSRRRRFCCRAPAISSSPTTAWWRWVRGGLCDGRGARARATQHARRASDRARRR